MSFHKKYQAATRGFCLVVFLNIFTSPLLGAMQNAADATQAQLSYKTIGSLNLSAVGLVKPDYSVISDFVPHDPRKDVCLEIHPLTERDKQEVIYNLFASREGHTPDCPSISTLAKDLELFVGQGANPHKHVLEKISHTRTTFGHAKLAHMLANPLTDINQLQKRQNLIKKLLDDQELFDQIEKLLQQIQQTENNFFSYWKTEKATQDFLDKRLFFKRGVLREYNTSPVAMEVVTRLCNAGTALIILGPLLGAMVYKYIDGKFIMPLDHNQPVTEPYTLYRAFKETCHYAISSVQPQTYFDFYTKIKNDSILKGSPEVAAQKWAVAKTTLETGKAVLYGAGQALATKFAIDEATLTNKSIRYLHTQLNGVASMINCCEQFNSFIKNHADFAEGLEYQNNFAEFFNTQVDSELSQLVTLLQTDTFKSEGSFFSHAGRVLAAHELMRKNKHRFTSVCLAIGEIDAAMSIAKLYKNSANNEVSYNFATFVESDKPVVELIGFWHPLVTANKVVTNNLILGATGPSHNAIVTGSNTGGKSTMLKSILLNILFAQTLTIIPAKNGVLTPFYYLGCYLHLADDLTSGNSLFKAEVLRVQAFLERVQKLFPNQFAFIVIDELFTGTAAETGASAAYKVAEKLTKMDNIVFVLATHFPELTELEKTTDGICKNYKVDAIKRADGTIFRPFKLDPGVSSTSIANEILRSELDIINFAL
jgi:hypothetical protein